LIEIIDPLRAGAWHTGAIAGAEAGRERVEEPMADKTVREAVGVFHDEGSLQTAADELLIAGFDRSHLSLLAGDKTVEKELGHKYEKVDEIEDDPAVPYLAYIGSDSRSEAKGAVIGGLAYVGAIGAAGIMVASGGTIAAVLIAVALAGGAGGVVGTALSRYLDSHHAHYLQDQLDRGGLLLWVRTVDAEHEKRAVEVLKRNSAADVHVHDLPDLKFEAAGGVSHDTSFMNRLGL
jgi:hypothetical protein